MANSFSPASKSSTDSSDPNRLTQLQIDIIERALQQIGEYGEVRLVVEKSKLRFIEVAKSLDVLKLQDFS